MIDWLVLAASQGCLALALVSKVHFLGVCFVLPGAAASVTRVASFEEPCRSCSFRLFIMVQGVSMVTLLKGLTREAGVLVLSFEEQTPLVALVLLGCRSLLKLMKAIGFIVPA